jgi:hypothetical protein
VFRNFRLTEKFNLRFRAEMLNFSNTPHWNNPSTSCSVVTPSSGPDVCGGSFGQITKSFGQRIFQLGAEIDF